MRKFLKYFQPLLFLFFGLFLLWLALKDINFSEFKITFKQIPFYWVFLSMLLGYLAFVFRGLRWQLLINSSGYQSEKKVLIHAIAFGYLFNSFIPRSGEIMRCTAVNRVDNTPVSALFGHVLLERLIDFILLGVCIFLTFLLNYSDFLVFFQYFALSFNLILYVTIFTLSLICVYRFRKSIFNKNHLLKMNSFFLGIKKGFLSIRKIQNKLSFFIYTILIWACYLFMTVVCFYCFEDTKALSLSNGLFIMVAGGLGMVVPTPTGIGSYHYLVISALGIIGVSRDISQFFALIVHTSQAIMIIVTGFIGMIYLYFHHKNYSNG